MTIVSIIAAAVFGLLVAFLNYRITKRAICASDETRLMAVNAVRFIIDGLALTVGFFVCKFLPVLPMTAILITIATAMVVGEICFNILIVRQEKNDEVQEKING